MRKKKKGSIIERLMNRTYYSFYLVFFYLTEYLINIPVYWLLCCFMPKEKAKTVVDVNQFKTGWGMQQRPLNLIMLGIPACFIFTLLNITILLFGISVDFVYRKCFWWCFGIIIPLSIVLCEIYIFHNDKYEKYFKEFRKESKKKQLLYMLFCVLFVLFDIALLYISYKLLPS